MEIFLNTSRKFLTIDLSLTANEETIKYLHEFGVKNVHHYGNIKLVIK